MGINSSSNKNCTNKAYYAFENKIYCGVHCKNSNRIELPKNPNKEQNKKILIENHMQNVLQEAKLTGTMGKVTCRKMKMMKEVELLPGFMNVFPNFKHENRKDGYGCKELSPMSLGPVYHMQPKLPECKNIENYHQGNKYFAHETIPQFLQKRLEMYLDPVPHRHKYDRKDGNIPLFSVHVDKDGMARGYSYLESRYFYCYFYERLAKQTKAFAYLIDCLKQGINLCIVGYDAYEPTKSPYQHYLDTTSPFGHEMVLWCLLTIQDTTQYPWNVFHENNKNVIYPF